MPSASFQHSLSVDATRDQVWKALMDPETWAHIGPVNKVWDPEFDGEILSGYQWSTEIGSRDFNGTANVIEHSAPDRYAIDLDAGEMAGTIDITLSDGNPTTDLDVTLDFRTKGMLSAMFWPIIKDAIGKGLPGQMEDFATTLSQGD